MKKKNKINIVSILKNKIFIISLISVVLISAGVITFSLVEKKQNASNKCFIQFDSNGGTTIENYEFKCGTIVENPNYSPNKEGFRFDGWTYQNEDFSFDVQLNGSIVLVAKYTLIDENSKVVTISFDSNGGSYVKAIEIVAGNKIVPPSDPIKNGYKFSGWYDLNNVIFDFDTEIADDITLKAMWEKSSKSDSNTNPNAQPPIVNNGESYECNYFIRTDDSPETVYTGYHGHISYIWNAAVVLWTEDKCSVKYTSSNSSVASIDSNGIVDTKNVGTTVLKGCVSDKKTKKQLDCFSQTLTVQQNNISAPTSIKCYGAKDEVGVSSYLGFTWESKDRYDLISQYYYITSIKSSDESVVKITDVSNGGYKSIKPGIATITVKTNNGLVGTCDIKVVQKIANSVKITGNVSDVHIGDSVQLKATYDPVDASEKFTWVSNDPSVASVDNNGRVKTLKTGYAQISIYNDDKTVNDSIIFEVKGIKVKSITLNKTKLDLTIGENSSLTATISPSDATNKYLFWSSSNYNVVTVDSDGQIRALSPGKATITVTDADNLVSATCSVTVKPIEVNSISLNKTSITLSIGQSQKLEATISPSNATNKNYNWSSSNSSIATVDNKGNIKAISVGTATITVTSEDGSHTATCNVEVIIPPLTGSASAGLTTTCSSSGCGEYVFIKITASGGTGPYTYHIDSYKDGISTGSIDSNEGYLSKRTGTYTFEWSITDSQNNTVTGTKSFTYSN